MINKSAHPDLGMDWSWDGEAITKANGFLFQPALLVSFQILIQFFLVTVNLQRKAADVVCAYDMIKGVVTTLNSIRTNSVVEFKKQATKLGKCLHGDEFNTKAVLSSSSLQQSSVNNTWGVLQSLSLQCESERSFSHLKTARRSTMTEARLTSLAMMKINRDRCNKLTSTEKMRELVKTFAQQHPRRIKLPFMLQD